MNANQEWKIAFEELRKTVISLGFPDELAVAISKNLGWPKAMRRMTAYLQYVRPDRVDLVVDEMLSIRQEILTWKEKKASQAANAAYNALLFEGLEADKE